MLKPIKIKDQECNIFFTSDLHIHHDRSWIVNSRGYKSVGEHDNALIHNWNSVCSNRSIVFHLGDMIFGDPDGAKFKALCRRLNFSTLFCLFGNHFSGQLAIYKEVLAAKFPDAIKDNGLIYEVYPLEYLVDGNPNKKVVFLPQYVDADINGMHVVLCHYPIISHLKMSKESWMLCGHSHSRCELTNQDTGNGMRLDVGVDSFGEPIPMSEVRKILAGRSIDAKDHHGKPEEQA